MNMIRRSSFYKNLLVLCSMASVAACTDEDIPATLAPQEAAYVRMIVISPYSKQLPARFYVNGLVNGNGDTAVYDTRGNLVSELTTTYTQKEFPLFFERMLIGLSTSFTSYFDLSINSATGIYTFNSPGFLARPSLGEVLTTGTVSFPNETTGYFPDATHRLQLAPVVNGYSYHKWAAFPAGVTNIAFRPSVLETVNFKPTVTLGPVIYQADINLEKEKLYTLFYTRTSFSTSDSDVENVVVLKEDPAQYQFNDSSTYVRFFNFTRPSKSDDQFNINTTSLDAYFVKFDQDSVSQAEVLMQSNLKRFAAEEQNSTFFEIDMRDILRELAPYGSGLEEDLLPMNEVLSRYTYAFRFYRTGESQEKSKRPLVEVPVEMIYTSERGVASKFTNALLLLAKDPLNFQPMVLNIVFTISDFNSARFGEGSLNTAFAVYNFEPNKAADAYLK
jgi:hypothetical protein